MHVDLTESLKTIISRFFFSSIIHLTGRSSTEQLHLSFCWDFLVQKEVFLYTPFSLFQQLSTVLLEDRCFWIVFLESLGSRRILLHCPLAVDYPSLLEPLREAPTAREYVKTRKSLNLREDGRLAKYASQFDRGRSLLKLLGAWIKPLQGLVPKVDTSTHLLEEKPIGSFLTPVVNLFIVSTSGVELQEARVSYFFEVDIHLHRGAIHQAEVTLFDAIQTQIGIFWKRKLQFSFCLIKH